MQLDDRTLIWVVAGLVAAVGLAIALAVSRRRARARSAELERRFGPEYERAVQEFGSRGAAERELSAREHRVQRFRFSGLNAADRARFEATWARVEEQFVDDPAVAVAAANQLISEVMRARGYPTENFEQRVADLSVGYPTVVQHFRAAHALSASTASERLDTEELRQAVVHFRVLFAELLSATTDDGVSRDPASTAAAVAR